MAEYDDFSNQPESVSEVRANRARDSALWTPRDALISVLRDLDSGRIKPEVLLVCMLEKQGDTEHPCYSVASDGLARTLGVMELVRDQMLRITRPV